MLSGRAFPYWAAWPVEMFVALTATACSGPRPFDHDGFITMVGVDSFGLNKATKKFCRGPRPFDHEGRITVGSTVFASDPLTGAGVED